MIPVNFIIPILFSGALRPAARPSPALLSREAFPSRTRC
jgi:hypothetical protein